MQGRKLFITSRGDTSGSGTLRLPGIRDQYERARGPKELVVLDGSAHDNCQDKSGFNNCNI